MKEESTYIHVVCSGKSRVTLRDSWKPSWLAPTANKPTIEAVEDSEVPTIEAVEVLEPPRPRRPQAGVCNQWTEHRDGMPWRVIQAAGEIVVPWRDDDDHEPKPGVCRCGAAETRDTSIHEGRSIRRDCANCGRLVSFPRWHERD